jgi:hypothetical protein
MEEKEFYMKMRPLLSFLICVGFEGPMKSVSADSRTIGFENVFAVASFHSNHEKDYLHET